MVHYLGRFSRVVGRSNQEERPAIGWKSDRESSPREHPQKGEAQNKEDINVSERFRMLLILFGLLDGRMVRMKPSLGILWPAVIIGAQI